MMLELQDQGCHNINFVTPEHVVPQVKLGCDTYVNLMDQYYPAGKVGAEHYPEINRRLTSREFAEARALARDLGLRRLDARRPRDYRAPSAFAARA